ncbi:hypothetical protein EVAR_37270_1 [Eumeta japonica]|uniref:Uncharacterized protein n=1 Tax=Eumeta variegata TaxID=151549 RepID=A0A4C1WMT7_EUMVA|nr:hypothetical protein EVAR_37270_1 [Eumeta japonica]
MMSREDCKPSICLRAEEMKRRLQMTDDSGRAGRGQVKGLTGFPYIFIRHRERDMTDRYYFFLQFFFVELRFALSDCEPSTVLPRFFS